MRDRAGRFLGRIVRRLGHGAGNGRFDLGTARPVRPAGARSGRAGRDLDHDRQLGARAARPGCHAREAGRQEIPGRANERRLRRSRQRDRGLRQG